MRIIIPLVLALTTTVAHANYNQNPLLTIKGGTGSSSQTANRACTTNGSGNIVSSSSTTDTEIGYVHGVTSAIQTQFSGKEPSITAGTSSQYWRGDKTFQTLDTSAVPENSNLYFTNARAIAAPITGYVSGAGTVAATDTILQAIQKLNGNIGAITTIPTVVNGGDAAYTIARGDGHIRNTTAFTAQRTYTLPACDASHIGEKHEIKNLPASTFNLVLAAAGSDNIDGASTYTLEPGDSAPVICAAFSAAGTWDIE